MRPHPPIPHQGSAIFPDQAWNQIAITLRLTRRELQVVRGIFDDLTEFAIADNLGISPHTVHTHVERLRRKLGVADRVGLVVHIMEEFLRLTSTPNGSLPPICRIHNAGQCRRHD